jgi:acyl-CoA synthetase (AMP-forming)/AMP-acid ligase II
LIFSEVEEVLNRVPGVRESCVYGVKVPGCEGRAGMALLVLNDNVPFSLDTLYERLILVTLKIKTKSN